MCASFDRIFVPIDTANDPKIVQSPNDGDCSTRLPSVRMEQRVAEEQEQTRDIQHDANEIEFLEFLPSSSASAMKFVEVRWMVEKRITDQGNAVGDEVGEVTPSPLQSSIDNEETSDVRSEAREWRRDEEDPSQDVEPVLDGH